MPSGTTTGTSDRTAATGAADHTALSERAREIFDGLGYAVSTEDHEISAARGWKEVRVTPVVREVDVPAEGSFRCFVTWGENVSEVRETLARADPEYEWAVIGVDREGEYEVAART